MTFYTIATKTNKCYGHGGYGVELRICREGAYRSEGNFPPLFKTKEAAQKYLDSFEIFYDRCVVGLVLVED